ncbi:Phage-related minor tail protein [Algoriella xinjiangensis]|uniref:phage tail tape measure protein n=1 Tax=Algoriella xinjiangensis TaxID=684065 RepID=UPI000F631504|nr:phage tail tape measure protein [Algoriella xinjiangensis]VDH16843.1 Phage-related minor tail protein [Algoriella xinjiangensis]
MANNTTTQLTIRINGREVERTLNGMGRELQQLSREVRNMNEADPNFNARVRDLRTLRREYNELRESVYGANQSTNSFLEGLKGVGAGIVAAFSIDKVLELSRLLLENVERTRELKKELASITGLDGSQLSAATTGTSAIAQTYKKDEKEIMISANNMSKTMSITYGEALEELKRGFKEGADASGDMLEQVKEYAPFIKEAGGEAKDLVNIIKSGVVDGVYNDKAIDAVKEGLLRIREMTPATRDAITNLGIDVNDMLDQIKNGQMSYMDAMLLVSKEMDKLGNKSTVTGQALADIFGGPGEDAGFKYISNLYKMNDGVSKLSKTQQEYNRIKDLELEANEKSAVLFEQLTGAGSKYAETMAEMKLAAVEFTAALFGIKEARASDDIRNQQISLKSLQNELVNTNTSTFRRKEILEEIQAIYPDIFKNLDLERASNEELSGAIDKVSESLRKRYAIQKAQEEVDDAGKEVGDYELRKVKIEEDIRTLIADVQTNPKYKISLPADFNSKDVLEQAKDVQSQLKNGFWESYFRTSDKSKLTGLVSDLGMINGYLEGAKTNLDDILKVQNRVLKTNVLPVEEYRSFYENYEKQRAAKWKESQSNTSNADPNRAAEIKRQAAEAAAAQKRAQAEAAAAAKRIKDERIRETKSLHDALIKEQEAFAKKIYDAQAQGKQAIIDLMKEGLQKELDQQELNSEKRIFAVNEEIAQLTKLREDYLKKSEILDNAAKKAGKGEDKNQYLADAQKYRDLAEEQVRIVAEKNSTIQSLHKKSDAEQLIIYSKYKAKEVELRQKANDDYINARKVEFNDELASATTLEETKKILKEKYGVEELSHITSLTDARNELMKEQNKVMLQEQLGALETELSELQKLLDDDAFSRENGLQILTDEDREKQVENLKQLRLEISEVNAAVTGEDVMSKEEKDSRDKNAGSQMLSGINILGFSADDWDQAFEKWDEGATEMEKFANKIKLVEMALQAAMTAWSMLSESQNKALDRNLKKYEQSNEARKKSLQKQLDEGVISQASYNAQVEALDEALAAKRAEIEYKKAMADWKMNLVSGQMNTALGITAALASSPPPYSYILAGITGAMGLAQLAIMMANKPQKSSFYNTGGPTVGLGYTDETGEEVAGTVHANEYVVPEWLREDPVVAKMEEFIEAKRLGRSPSLIDYPTKYATGGEVKEVSSVPVPITSIDNNLIQLLINYVENGNELLAKLIIEGVKLSRTMEGAKQLSEDIEKYKSLMNKSKKS